jgi:transcriptional regulator with XRE-family HTH domain
VTKLLNYPSTMPKNPVTNIQLHPVARMMADNFKAMRQKAGTQEEVGVLMGLSQAQVSRLEQGKSLLHMSELAKKIEHAGMDPLDLFAQDGEVQDPSFVEIRRLWPFAGPVIRGVILELLRNEARQAQATDRRVVGTE